MKTTRMQFNSLREWRRAMGYTQAQASRMLKVSQGCYSKWESHKAPKRLAARAVSERTGVPLALLLRIA